MVLSSHLIENLLHFCALEQELGIGRDGMLASRECLAEVTLSLTYPSFWLLGFATLTFFKYSF